MLRLRLKIQAAPWRGFNLSSGISTGSTHSSSWAAIPRESLLRSMIEGRFPAHRELATTSIRTAVSFSWKIGRCSSDGTPHDLGNLGGVGGIAGNHACALNNRGQAVGHSELANNATFHGFLWTEAR